MKPILNSFVAYYGTMKLDTLDFEEFQTSHQLALHREDLVAEFAKRANRDKASITRFTFVELRATYDRRNDAYGLLKAIARFNHLGEEIAL